jgi:hypothetical protein
MLGGSWLSVCCDRGFNFVAHFGLMILHSLQVTIQVIRPLQIQAALT